MIARASSKRCGKVKVATRGPKSSAALREMGVPVAVTAPEPCTWREMIGALDGAFGPSLEGLRAAVQEYGSHESRAARRAQPSTMCSGRECRSTSGRCRMIWSRCEIPSASIAAGKMDVVVFLTAVQVTHLFQVAEEMGEADALRDGMRKTVVLSIGPSTSEELARS